MIQVWECEVCGKEFSDKDKCLEHEKNCKILCDKCGKDISKINFHHIKPFLPFYGSKLDGRVVELNLCDECLCSIINKLTDTAKERIEFSEANYCDIRNY